MLGIFPFYLILWNLCFKLLKKQSGRNTERKLSLGNWSPETTLLRAQGPLVASETRNRSPSLLCEQCPIDTQRGTVQREIFYNDHLLGKVIIFGGSENWTTSSRPSLGHTPRWVHLRVCRGAVLPAVPVLEVRSCPPGEGAGQSSRHPSLDWKMPLLP